MYLPSKLLIFARRDPAVGIVVSILSCKQSPDRVPGRGCAFNFVYLRRASGGGDRSQGPHSQEEGSEGEVGGEREG